MSSTPTISLLRRLGAMIYDTVLAGFSVVIVSSIPAVLFQSLTGYRVPDSVMTVGYIFLTYLFFTWFWTHGGQTLGMRAWKIRVVDLNNQPLTWTQAGMRFFWSLISWMVFGLGYVWALFDPEQLTLHDRMSKTRLVRVADNKTKQ